MAIATRPNPASIWVSMPFCERSPTHISSAFFKRNSLHQVAIFLLSRDPGACGETASAQPSRISLAVPFHAHIIPKALA